ncbi:MAG TPA: hypothetical protein VMT18_07885 [Planctomycetota bacterium]|nr:hypothetical protein [Planctomycetota bacterium]
MSYRALLRPGVLACLFVLTATARAAPQDWAVQFGTTLNDRPYDIVSDGAGGAFVAGTRFTVVPNWEWQATVAHVLPGGAVDWSHEFGVPGGDDYAYAVALDGAGGAVFAGATDGDLGPGSNGGRDAFVARYDGQGQLLWLRQYGTAGLEEARGICSDGAGGHFVAGWTLGGFGGSTAGPWATWVMRLDGGGNVQWILPIFDSVGSTQPTSVVADETGGLYVCGWTSADLTGAQAGGNDAFLARIDAGGGLVWLSQFGGVTDDHSSAVALAPDQGAFVGGRRKSPIPFESTDAFLSRIDPAGNVLWTRTDIQPNWDDIEGLAPNGSGGVFACSNAVAPLSPSFDAFYASISGEGALEYVKYVGDLFTKDFAPAIASDGGSGLLLAGWTNASLFGPELGGDDIFVAHYDGCELDPWSVDCESTPNSTGKTALIGAYGSSEVTNDDFKLVTASCPSSTLGLFVMGATANSTPFGNGVLCVGGSVLRLLPALNTGTSGSTFLELDFDDPSSPASQIAPGSTWNFQFWFRDLAAGGAGFNLSNGLSVTFCP